MKCSRLRLYNRADLDTFLLADVNTADTEIGSRSLSPWTKILLYVPVMGTEGSKKQRTATPDTADIAICYGVISIGLKGTAHSRASIGTATRQN